MFFIIARKGGGLISSAFLFLGMYYLCRVITTNKTEK